LFPLEDFIFGRRKCCQENPLLSEAKNQLLKTSSFTVTAIRTTKYPKTVNIILGKKVVTLYCIETNRFT